MISQENNQVTSQGDTSQEENLLQEKSEFCQEGDTQSTASAIGESSHLTRMSSTQPIAVRMESLKDRLREAWEDEREFCLQQKELLFQEIQELQSELERTSACVVPPLCLCSLFWKKNRKAAKENQKLKDKCQKLKGLISEFIKLQVNTEKQLQHLDEFGNNHKKIQAWESEKRIMLERIKEKETLLMLLLWVPPYAAFQSQKGHMPPPLPAESGLQCLDSPWGDFSCSCSGQTPLDHNISPKTLKAF
ncbi:uncharacterized protein LOC115568444 isoform X2 [Sparus aurata]|uniref:uncharacterized protein LOC115568444 isoform X2 n=1 Tax=Sparus aurata TaxID=8175 RepID=UPI0011C18A76|nr:uncharacterized protein LOC115568444 isoform X2 [Sparus aurata]